MPDAPAAEVPVDEALVRRLLVAQATDLPGADRMPLHLADEGWDNHVWRLGEDYAVRMPRRAASADLVAHEQRWLPTLAPGITAASGLAIPVPVVRGVPSADFPWPWSVVPWSVGTAGPAVAPADRGGWAAPLARALDALHRPAPPDHPVNPFRGVPLAARDSGVRERIAGLRDRADGPRLARAAGDAWNAALAAAPWHGAALWIHGDLHPGNLVARGARLISIIDFGDLTAGDPAYDLSVAWLAFDRPARDEFIGSVRAPDADTWVRARGWAAAMGTMLAMRSDDRPTYRALGLQTLHRLADGG